MDTVNRDEAAEKATYPLHTNVTADVTAATDAAWVRGEREFAFALSPELDALPPDLRIAMYPFARLHAPMSNLTQLFVAARWHVGFIIETTWPTPTDAEEEVGMLFVRGEVLNGFSVGPDTRQLRAEEDRETYRHKLVPRAGLADVLDRLECLRSEGKLPGRRRRRASWVRVGRMMTEGG